MGLLSSNKPAAPERRSRRTTSEDRLDPAQELRRRARRRLVGAIALVLAAVIVLPMLLDTKRAPLPDDIPISIPGKTPPPAQVAVTPPESTQPAVPPQPQSQPSTSPSTSVPTVNTPSAQPTPTPTPQPQHQTPTPRPETPARTPEPIRPEPRPEPTRPEPAPVPTAPRAETPTPVAPTRPATEAADAARARALLEGRPAVVASASRQEPAKGAFVIQVGAYSTEARAQEVRDRLSGAGLKAFTERVRSGQGDIYRVRVGPYATREAADGAREKIKSSAGLDSSIVSL